MHIFIATQKYTKLMNSFSPFSFVNKRFYKKKLPIFVVYKNCKNEIKYTKFSCI